ncbi:hypothetical protein HanPI659440_Chr15g0579031 [Helianthus annuus]|nr:hypothetical protein HanPI659440_Chr15g0579031 [Helianthus annuus]
MPTTYPPDFPHYPITLTATNERYIQRLRQKIKFSSQRRRRPPPHCHRPSRLQQFLDWYVKIGVVSAAIGGSMEYFMIKTGFYDKVTVLESEKRAWENSPEAQAMREALNPWRNTDANARKPS